MPLVFLSKTYKVLLRVTMKKSCFTTRSITTSAVKIILNYFMAYRVYLSDYLPLDIGTTTAYLKIGANQFALIILKLFI